MEPSDRLVGNRLALVGSLLYFLEWVAIVFLPDVADAAHFGSQPEVVVAAYRDHARAVAFAAGWFALVLLGRILFAVALRKAFQDSGQNSVLIDFAVGAMIVSVTIEIVSFGPAAAAAWLTNARVDASAIAALEAAASLIFLIVFVPLGASILAASGGMLVSHLFPQWLGAIALVAGTCVVVGGILQVAALSSTGRLFDIGGPVTSVGAVGFWIWILVTSIILWRHTPPRARPDLHQRRSS
jgi:hypothetical protein